MLRQLVGRFAIRPIRRKIDHLRFGLGRLLSKRPLKGNWKPAGNPRVLVLGVYVATVPNLAAELALEFSQATACNVEQRWASLGKTSSNSLLAKHTIIEQLTKMPKFELLNQLISQANIDHFDYLVFADDDVSVNPGFIDQYIALQQSLGFSIAQPARTWASHLDHKLVRRHRKMTARQTWFVEIGPIFSFSQALTKHLLPFNLETPMGWGYDFVWPRIVKSLGGRMGVIDHTPVDHTLRRRGANYSSATAASQGMAYREKYQGLTDEEAFVVVKAYPRGEAL
jgi:hypothetical protein